MRRSVPRLQIRAVDGRGRFRRVSSAHGGGLTSGKWGVGWHLLLLTALASFGFEGPTRPGFPSWDFTIHPSVTLRHLPAPRTHTGATVRLSRQEQRPLTLATADFNGDGVLDLLVGSGAPGMGQVTLFQGVPDGDPLTGEPLGFPFARTETSVDLDASPEFLQVGDYDADGYHDWVAGQSGSSKLIWGRGDGTGLFQQSRSVELPGPLSTLTSGDVNRRDGLEDLLVGVGGDSPCLLVFEGPLGALRSDPEELPLDAMPADVAFGQLDDHYALDLVVAAGDEIVVFHGRDRKLSLPKKRQLTQEPRITRIPFSSEIESLAVGNFISDPDGQKDFAVLTRLGQLLLLGDPLRSQERPIVLGSLGPQMGSLVGQYEGFGTWSRKLLYTRLSSLPIDTPLVLDAGSGDAWLALDESSDQRLPGAAHSGEPRLATIPLSLPGSVVAALPMRIGAGALDDLVWLSSTSPFPQVTLTGPGGQFQVNVSEDEDDGTCNAEHCSLREAISASNASAGLDTITFSVSTATIGTVPASPITDAVNVVGPVEIVGGLLLNGGNSEVRGLTGGSVRFGVGNNRVVSSQLSSVSLHSSDNTVGGTSSSERNIISGGAVIGVFINADSNLVQGNYIGTDEAGEAAMGHGFNGVVIINASNNTVGGTTAGARNVVSGNGTRDTNPIGGLRSGIQIQGGTSSGNLVQGNFVGSDHTGKSAIPNAMGVEISRGNENTIGGTTPGARNIIVSNSGDGVFVEGDGNLIQGNYIGVNVDGEPLGNGDDGVELQGFFFTVATNTVVGGAMENARNVISANGGDGVVIIGGTINGEITLNSVVGNFIGTNPTATVPEPNGEPGAGGEFGNGRHGVFIQSAPDNDVIGNVISGNLASGISLRSFPDSSTSSRETKIQGNWIGTNLAGDVALGNAFAGIFVEQTPDVMIGGSSESDRTLISGNGTSGIIIRDPLSTGNRVLGNRIGTNENGTQAVPNGQNGVFLFDAPGNFIGGTASGEGNLISGNGFSGVSISQDDASGNRIRGNHIGTQQDGTSPLATDTTASQPGEATGNGRWGVVILGGAHDNSVGGDSEPAGNRIAFNGRDGVQISSGTGNAIRFNRIFDNQGLGIDLGQDDQVTPNDPPAGTEPPFDPPADSDDGANRLQNFPVLSRVENGTQVEVSLLSTPGQSFTIDLYSNDSCDPSGNGEGQQHLGTLQITTNAQGIFDCGVGACLFPVPADKDITATATDPDNNTSEFSFCGVEEIVVNSVEDDPLKQNATTCTTADEVFKTRTGEEECTLRAAIKLANQRPGRDRIEFDIKEGSAPYTIQPSKEALPEISTPMSIDGTTQPGFVEGFFPLIELTGIDAGEDTNGLVVTGGSSEIKGLVINAFSGNGVVLKSQGGNRLDLNYIGTSQNGQNALPNKGYGVFVDNTSNNHIGLPDQGQLPRNVISGNLSDGVRVEGRNASLNEIKGNYIGLDAFGSSSVGNKGSGINVIDGAFSNLILGNVVSGNELTGVRLSGCAVDECEDLNDPTQITRQNQVFVNLIGTDASGFQARPNVVGVSIIQSNDNTIGGVGRRNLISGNEGPGVFVFGLNANDNKIQGNYIGTDPEGDCPEFLELGQCRLANSTRPLLSLPPFNSEPVLGGGIFLQLAGETHVGGAASGLGNLIAGNGGDGINLDFARGVKVEGNRIGTDVSGKKVIPNLGNGVHAEDSRRVIIGGSDRSPATCDASCNLISGNLFNGVLVNRGDPVQIEGNFIGTDIDGELDRGNGASGIFLTYEVLAGSGEQGQHIIGGEQVRSGNLISGNDVDGIRIQKVSSTDIAENHIYHNLIGTNADGTSRLPNTEFGISILGSSRNSIGAPGSGNVIAANGFGGILVAPSELGGPDGNNTIYSNYVGTNSSEADLGNLGAGIEIHTSGNEVGGDNQDEGNVIAFNLNVGVGVAKSDRNLIFSNRIFDNDDLGIDLQAGNDNMYYPMLESATSGNTLIRGRFPFPLIPPVTLQFFSNPACHRSGNGEGRHILGHLNLPAGRSDFRVRPPNPVAVGHFVTVTATDDFGNTSEFSNCVVAQLDSDGDGVPDALEPPDLVNDGQKTSTPGGTRVEVDDPGVVLELNPNSSPLTLPSGINLGDPIDIQIDLTSSGPSGSSVQGSVLQGRQEVTVTLTLPEGFLATTYYNYGPEPNNPEPHWYEFLFDGRTGATIKGQRILLRLVDGLRGDHDLEPNGIIETLGAPANLADLLFPFFQIEPGSFVGVAVSNFSEVDAELNFEARDADGDLLPAGENPATRFLSSGQQLARLSHELLSSDPLTPLKGWLRVDTDNPRLGSFFQFGDLARLDGSVAITRAVRRLFFTRVFEGDTAFRGQPASTEIFLANPGKQEITVQLRLLGSGPGNASNASLTPQASQAVSIPAGGVLSQTVAVLFGAESIDDGVIKAEVDGVGGIAGFELIRLSDRNTVIGLNAAQENPFVQLYSAQLASVPGIFTSVKVVNTAEQQRTVTLEAVGEDGSPLADPISRNLDPEEVLIGDAGQLFASALEGNPAGLVGSLRLRADGPGIVGDVVFGDPDDLQYAAALPLQSRPFKQAVFSQVANISGFFTGMALYAPDEAAKVSIEVYTAGGELVGRSVQRLGAGQRLSKLASELVPASDGQVGGYIMIRSTRPLIAQQLFGVLDSTGIQLLSAVPPTVVDELVEVEEEQNPVPTLSSIEPSSVAAGDSSFLLRVLGSNFIQGSVVRWKGQNRPTTFVSSVELQSEISAADIAQTGQAEITVFNPVPTLSSLDPSSVTAGSGAFTLIVTGSSFLEGSQVRWNGQGRPTTFFSAGELRAEIGAADVQQVGQAEITVFNPPPGGGFSPSLVLTIDPAPNPVPVLSVLDPPSATAGSGAFTLNLTGSGFFEGSKVRWDGADRPTAFVSSSELQAEISAADVGQVGQVQVTVFNPQPGGGSSAPLAFVIDPVPNPVPVLDSLDPPSAIEGSGDLTLNLVGSGFFEGSQVLWNGATRPTTFVDSTHLQAEISASDLAVAGPVEVAVFNPAPGGGTSIVFLFDVVDFTAPEISDAEVEMLSTDSVRIRFRFEDPDGDVVQLIFTWFLNATQITVREVNSPEDVDLTGLTSGIITGTFTNLTVLNPFAVRPNEVRIVVIDAQGLSSNTITVKY